MRRRFPDRSGGGLPTLGRRDCEPLAHPTADGHPTIARPSCFFEDLPPGPERGGFLWLRADREIPAYMTVDGSNRTVKWINQFPPLLDADNNDSFGFTLPVGQWPVWTPNVRNSLGAMMWSRAAHTNLNHYYPDPGPPRPTDNNEPVMLLAVVGVADNIGGNVLTYRFNNNDLEFGLFTRAGGAYQIPMSNAQDAVGVVFGHGSTVDVYDFTGQQLLCDWSYFGPGIAPEIGIDGTLKSLYQDGLTMQGYGGNSGYTVGATNANFNSIWNGPIMEILGYRFGTFANMIANYASVRADARGYLARKWNFVLP